MSSSTFRTRGIVGFPVSILCFRKIDTPLHMTKGGELEQILSSTRFLSKIRFGGRTRDMMGSCGT